MQTGAQTTKPDSVEDSLWISLRGENAASARAKLIEQYYPYAKKLAARTYAHRRADDIDFSDYLHYAVVGLIESIDRFDVSRGVPFEAFSSRRIRGAILNGIEKYTELREQISHITRLRRERLKAVAADNDDTANDHDLFASLTSIVVNLALGYFLEDSELHASSSVSARDQLPDMVDLEQLRTQVSGIVKLLPERERTIIQYHYYHQMAFNDISDVMAISTGRVSQLHKRALGRVRESLRSLLSLDQKY